MAEPQRLELANAARRLTNAANIGARERRRFRRAPLILTGRMLDSLGREHDCRTADISPGDVRLASPILPEVGQHVVIYLDGLGRVAGSVARRCGEAEVAIIFQQSAHKREKMAEALTWAINQSALDLEGAYSRAAAANDPAVETARIEFETGQIIDGEVLDFSLAGISIRTTKPMPPIGAWARVGNIYGRVARPIEGGFAIDFEAGKPQHI